MRTRIGGVNNGIEANRHPSNKYELTAYGAFSILYYVHETANTPIGAHVEMQARYVKGQDALDRQVSWHITSMILRPFST